MVVGGGDGKAFVRLECAVVVNRRVGEGADVRATGENEGGPPGGAFEDFVVEKLGPQARQDLPLVGNGDLLDGSAADRFVAGGDDFDAAAPEEDGVAGIMRDIVHSDDMVEGLAHGDE